MIEIKNLHKAYKNGESEFALDVDSLSFESQGLYVLTGRSGCGKTTFLDILAGLNAPDSGSVLFDGKPASYDASFYRNVLSYDMVDGNVVSSLNVSENLSLATKDKKKREAMAEKLGLNLHRKASKLSKGETARLAIGMNLLKECPILLVDEPTANLDDTYSVLVFQMLKAYSEDHLVIVVSHDTELAKEYADILIRIENGKIVKLEGKVEVGGETVAMQKTEGRPSGSLWHLGFKKALTSWTAYAFSVFLLFFGFFFGFLGFNYFSLDEKATFAKVLGENAFFTVKDSRDGEERMASREAYSKSGKEDIVPYKLFSGDWGMSYVCWIRISPLSIREALTSPVPSFRKILFSTAMRLSISMRR